MVSSLKSNTHTEAVSPEATRPEWLAEVWTAEEWQARAQAHRDALEGEMAAYVRRRAAHQKDPILDFLFEYYRFRPAQLLRWTPGVGVLLLGDEAIAAFAEKTGFSVGYGGVYLDPSKLSEKRRNSVQWIATLLANTAAKPPSFGCYGMHEWAMVYRAEEVRHQQFPLRLSDDALAAFVEERPLVCTHFDAWRFFTKAAKPMNRFALSRDVQQEMEQPGCLHANMDLYKWAYKLFPWISTTLTMEAYHLAVEARRIDMQASPYDLTDEGLAPIPVETAAGRELYKERQQALWQRAAPIRAALHDACEQVLLCACG